MNQSKAPHKAPWSEKTALQKATLLLVMGALTCSLVLSISVGPDSDGFRWPVRVVGLVCLVASIVLIVIRWRHGERFRDPSRQTRE